MNKLLVIAKNAYKKNIRSFTFMVLILVPIVTIGLAVVIGIVNANRSGTIAYVTINDSLKEALERSPTNNNLIFPSDFEQAKEQLFENQVDLIIEFEEEAKGPGEMKIYTDESEHSLDISSETETTKIHQAYEYGEEYNIPPTNIEEIINGEFEPAITFLELNSEGEPSADTSDEEIRSNIAYFINALLAFFVLFYMHLIANELGRDKGNRIMEIVISSMKAEEHFYGKLLGMFLMILTHIGIYLILLCIILLLNSHYGWISFHIEPLNTDLWTLIKNNQFFITVSLAFFILGTVIYTSLTTFISSLSNKLDDVLTLTLPLRVLMSIGYFIGIMAGQNLYLPLVKIASFIPFWSPFTVPILMISEDINHLEVIISILVSILFIFISFKLSTTLYKSNLLTYTDGGLIQSLKRSTSIFQSNR